MNNNCSEEASCLATDIGSFGEELEIEYFYEYCDACNIQGFPMEEEEDLSDYSLTPSNPEYDYGIN
jgi:hypothetical protein